MIHRGLLLVSILGVLSSCGRILHVEGFVSQPKNNHVQLLPSRVTTSSIVASSLNNEDHESVSRRDLMSIAAGAVGWMASSSASQAAPPIAVIAEELGYFPVTTKEGEMKYVPKRIQRESSKQAIELAQKLSDAGAVMFGAFWCPHCARQKELLGREAWQYITYVECSSQGWGSKPLVCKKQNVDGYPTWIFRDKTELGGERPLEDLAKKVNFQAFNPELEQNVPPPLGSTACKQ